MNQKFTSTSRSNSRSNMSTDELIAQDHAHIWHPFTPMQQWRDRDPLVIECGEGCELIDTEGQRYIDGVSSLWCNVHGHRVKKIDDAVRDQLDKIAHSTLLGLASVPSIEFAARLIELVGQRLPSSDSPLTKVFYSDAGATAVEIAFKMAVGYWHHVGQSAKTEFIGVSGAYHGDTTGAMSVGYSDLFHRPFQSMVFPTRWLPSPDPCRPPDAVAQKVTRPHADCVSCRDRAELCDAVWPSECPLLATQLRDHLLQSLEAMLQQHGDTTAAIVVEPIMQGAAGMINQPIGLLRGIRELATKYNVLLIADEVATGFGRTGPMFACEHERVVPDLMCLAKGITGGYLPMAVTLASDKIELAFTGDDQNCREKTFYHGHTYTGNALACAAAIASLDLFDEGRILEYAGISAKIMAGKLSALRSCKHVRDVRQRGLMVGIELDPNPDGDPPPFDFAKRTGAAVCEAMRSRGLIVRSLGDIVVLMPAPAMPHEMVERMCEIVVDTIGTWKF